MIILGTNSIKDTGYDVANSVRLDGSSAYMHKTPGSAGNRKTFTISAWVKRSGLGSDIIFGAGSNPEFIVGWQNTNTDQIGILTGDGNILLTNRLYRDTSAWYHIVVAVDTTQGTDTNRCKLYVNGVQETSFASTSYPSQDADLEVNNTVSHQIGRFPRIASRYYDGYLSEFVLIDGLQLDATSFGEFDSDSNIWKPIDVSGLTFGTNGFYLDFEDSANLGNDANGGTDLTEVNLAATDQSTDTCTNNFATLNSLINFNSGVFSEGNLAITSGDDTVSTIGLTSGRWYWEAQRTNTTNEAHIGIGVSKSFGSATSVVSSGDRIYVRGGATFVSAVSNLGILTFASNSGTPATISNGDVIGFYLDLESSTKNITVKKNDGATPIIDIDLTYSGEEPIFPFCRMNSGCASSWNFGNPIAALSSANADANGFGSFEFNPTKGGVDYFAICTKNLAEYG